jgi:hypothetical protein
MKCPVQAFVAFALFIGGCATKPEAPQAAMTGNLVVRNLTEYTLTVTRIGMPVTRGREHDRGPGGGGERFYPIVYVSPYQTITLTNKDSGIVIGFFADQCDTSGHKQHIGSYSRTIVIKPASKTPRIITIRKRDLAS